MAIINNSNQPENEPEKMDGIIKSRTGAGLGTGGSTDAGIGGGTETKKIPEFPVKAIVSIVAVIGVLAALYFIFTQPSIPNPEPVPTVSHKPIPKADISLVLEKMMRIGGLMDLLENKIIQTEKSIIPAEKLGDKVILSTLRLGRARNLNDLERHQDMFISELVKLHQFYLEHSDYLVKVFKETLKKSEDTYKVGNAKTISNIQRLLRSVPEGTQPLDYFKKEIKVQY